MLPTVILPNFEGKEEQSNGLSLRGLYSMLLVQPLKNVSFLGTLEKLQSYRAENVFRVNRRWINSKLSFRAFILKLILVALIKMKKEKW